MDYQNVFKRYELKYLLTQEQKEQVLLAMEPYMSLDQYGRTTIRNIYFDTDNYRLVRRSIESPVYKEKLRIRSYCHVSKNEPVFVELKKKYQSVVYKRRIVLPQEQAMFWLQNGASIDDNSQIAEEIEYFRDYYRSLRSRVFLSYEREAYFCTSGSDFRVTFDEDILSRTYNLSLCSDTGGTPLLGNGQTLMEIKTSGGIPLWMSSCLTKNKIRKSSFSKYGVAYCSIIAPQSEGGILYA